MNKTVLALGSLIIIGAGLAAVDQLIPPAQQTSQAAIQSPKTAPARPPLIPFPLVDIVSWERGGFNNVAIVTVKITNISKDAWIADVAIACSFTGNSGTVINSSTVTVFERIDPSKAHTAKRLNMGFVNQQTKSASCRPIGAKVPPGREML